MSNVLRAATQLSELPIDLLNIFTNPPASARVNVLTMSSSKGIYCGWCAIGVSALSISAILDTAQYAAGFFTNSPISSDAFWIYEEKGRTYMLYSVAIHSGITMTELTV